MSWASSSSTPASVGGAPLRVGSRESGEATIGAGRLGGGGGGGEGRGGGDGGGGNGGEGGGDGKKKLSAMFGKMKTWVEDAAVKMGKKPPPRDRRKYDEIAAKHTRNIK